MNELLPCVMALIYMAIAGGLGYGLGRIREQLRLLQLFKPET